jgi:hypothetical protein
LSTIIELLDEKQKKEYVSLNEQFKAFISGAPIPKRKQPSTIEEYIKALFQFNFRESNPTHDKEIQYIFTVGKILEGLVANNIKNDQATGLGVAFLVFTTNLWNFAAGHGETCSLKSLNAFQTTLEHGYHALYYFAEPTDPLFDEVKARVMLLKSARGLCASCGKQGDSTCGQCKVVRFCSKECQKAAWKVHKKACGHASVESVRKELMTKLPWSALIMRKMSSQHNHAHNHEDGEECHSDDEECSDDEHEGHGHSHGGGHGHSHAGGHGHSHSGGHGHSHGHSH